MLMPPQQNNQYDFILNKQQPQRSFNGGSKKARIILVVAGIIIFIILAVIANKILNAGDSAQTQRLTDVAKAETELIRVSTLGITTAKDRDTIAFASTVKLSVQSSQNQTKKLLEKRGINSKKFSKLMPTSKNSKTDTQLIDAGRNNRYDETFMAILDKELIDYQKLLKAANDGGKPSEQKVLASSFANVGQLLPLETPKPKE